MSETTGLPELPKGQWWEVRPCMVQWPSYGGGVSTIRDGYEVCIMTPHVTPETVNPGKHWWNRPVIVPETTGSRVVMCRQITDPSRYKAARDGTGWPCAYQQVGAEFITPEMVLKAAKDCMDRVEDRARADAEAAERYRVTAGLVGKYPPKTLPC